MNFQENLQYLADILEATALVNEYQRFTETMSAAQNYKQLIYINEQIRKVLQNIKNTDIIGSGKLIEQNLVKIIYYFDYLNSFYKTSPTAEYQKYVANGFNIINGVFNTLKTLMKHGCKLLHYWNNVPIDERQINLTWYRDAIQIEKLGAAFSEQPC